MKEDKTELEIDGRYRQKAEAIRDDLLSGSVTIAGKAVRLFREFYDEAVEQKLDRVLSFSKLLKEAKPSMAALQNVIDAITEYLVNGYGAMAFDIVRDQAANSTRDTLDNAYKDIFVTKKHRKIMTCSYSSTVLNLLEKAAAGVEGLKVLALESSWNNVSYGQELKERCKERGIACELVPDGEMAAAVEKCDCIITGADRIIENEGVVNGVPTLKLAQAAFPTKPFYVIAESFKKTSDVVCEKGYQFVLGKYIAKIYSDNLFLSAIVDADHIIRKFRLQPHPEGGYYSETYKSNETVRKQALPERYGSARSWSTCIYYMLKSGQASKFHRLKTDEIWHFYLGCPLEVFIIGEKGSLKTIRLGNNLMRQEIPQLIIPRNSWFAARPTEGGAFSLIGCTVAPGFDFEDFEQADGKSLMKLYPEYKDIIIELT